jgi:hypothetical protein
MPRFIVPTMLVFTVCAAGASAMEVRDLRFGLGIGPTPDGHSGVFTPNDGSAPFAFDVDYGASTATTGLVSATFGMLDPIGLIAGAELRYSNSDSSMDRIWNASIAGRGAPGSSYTESAAALHAGIGWAPGEADHFEAVGIMGFAWATLDSPANVFGNIDAQRGNGNGMIYGARLGWMHTWESRWQVGLQIEWTETDIDLTTNYIDGTLTSQLETSGVGARALIGYRH